MLENKQRRILVTGGSGMVGSALHRLVMIAASRKEKWFFVDSSNADLRKEEQIAALFKENYPTHIIHLAAKVGGIQANQDAPGKFFYDNVMMNTLLLEYARKYKVEKVVSCLSTCIYPNNAIYPLTEKQLHDGPPHESNAAYAYAKRMLDVQSQSYRKQYGCNFVTVVPNNLFGKNDYFGLRNSHVIPAIIRKVWEAKQSGKNVGLWGDGSPLREFTYADDLARILLWSLDNYNKPIPLNVGNIGEVSIKDLAEKISACLEYEGRIDWDTHLPNGQKRKPSSNHIFENEYMTSFKNWKGFPYTNFDTALKETCEWFKENYPHVRGFHDV